MSEQQDFSKLDPKKIRTLYRHATQFPDGEWKRDGYAPTDVIGHAVIGTVQGLCFALEESRATLARVTAERDEALKRKDEWHDRFNIIAAERAAMEAEMDALQAKVDAATKLCETITKVLGTSGIEPASQGAVDDLAILTAPLDVETGETK